MKVLIVEDELLTLEFLAEALADDDIELYVAKSANDAIGIAMTVNPDLIITDINMPGKSGLELSAEIKSNYILSDTPILAVSADESATAVKGAFHALVVDYIEKPVNPQYLKQLVKMHSSLHNISQASNNFQMVVNNVIQQLHKINICKEHAVH